MHDKRFAYAFHGNGQTPHVEVSSIITSNRIRIDRCIHIRLV